MSIELSTIETVVNQPSLVGALNANFDKVEVAINDLLDGESVLHAPLDCNGQALMNAVLSDACQIGGMSVGALISLILSLKARVEALEALKG